MGPLVSKEQQERVQDVHRDRPGRGDDRPCRAPTPDDPKLANGYFVPPTIFADVEQRRADRARGDLRPGDVGDPVLRAPDDVVRAVERQRVRPRRRGLDARHQEGHQHGARRSAPASCGSTTRSRRRPRRRGAATSSRASAASSASDGLDDYLEDKAHLREPRRVAVGRAGRCGRGAEQPRSDDPERRDDDHAHRRPQVDGLRRCSPGAAGSR